MKKKRIFYEKQEKKSSKCEKKSFLTHFDEKSEEGKIIFPSHNLPDAAEVLLRKPPGDDNADVLPEPPYTG